MEKPRTYRNNTASERIPVSQVSKPIVGRYVKDSTAKYGVKFVESIKTK